jgi:hypothetical protein
MSREKRYYNARIEKKFCGYFPFTFQPICPAVTVFPYSAVAVRI